MSGKKYRLTYRLTTERSLEFMAGDQDPERIATTLLPTGEGLVDVTIVSIEETLL